MSLCSTPTSDAHRVKLKILTMACKVSQGLDPPKPPDLIIFHPLHGHITQLSIALAPWLFLEYSSPFGQVRPTAPSSLGALASKAFPDFGALRLPGTSLPWNSVSPPDIPCFHLFGCCLLHHSITSPGLELCYFPVDPRS